VCGKWRWDGVLGFRGLVGLPYGTGSSTSRAASQTSKTFVDVFNSSWAPKGPNLRTVLASVRKSGRLGALFVRKGPNLRTVLASVRKSGLFACCALACTFLVREPPHRVRFRRLTRMVCTIFVLEPPCRVQKRTIFVYDRATVGQKTYTAPTVTREIVHGGPLCVQESYTTRARERAVGKERGD
jgi:hypothetical protein